MARTVARLLVNLRKMRRKRGRFDVYKVWFFAVVIGVAAAYGVIAFRFAIDAVSMLAFGETEEMAVSAAASLSFARAWAAPVMGGLVVSLILYLASRFAWLEGGRPQNVADVIEARAAYNKALIDEHIEHHK